MNYRIKQIKFLLGLILLLLVSCSKSITATITTNTSTNMVSVTESDSVVMNIIAPYKEQLDVQMNKVIGNASVELTKGDYQSSLANFINDIVLKKSREYYGKPIDFAVVTNGGLRTQIQKGEITVGNIYELMPFENELVVLNLKGSTAQKLLNYAAKMKNVTFSGVKYEIENEKPLNIFINEKPIEENNIYSIVISDYLANGGDGLSFLSERIEYIPLGKMYRDAILEGIEDVTKSKMRIYGKVDDRVKI